jgi:acyl-CoA synthetase (AMP-forming)/AMP-acid ligase II
MSITGLRLNIGDLMRNIGYYHAQFIDRLGDTFRWQGANVYTSEVEDAISIFKGIEHVSVYGVEIPGIEGRAGMLSIVTKQTHIDFDFNSYLELLKKNLPKYAIPKFIRFLSELSTTGTFKIQKSEMKNDGYDISKTSDLIYILIPGEEGYTLLAEKVYSIITNKKYRF